MGLPVLACSDEELLHYVGIEADAAAELGRRYAGRASTQTVVGMKGQVMPETMKTADQAWSVDDALYCYGSLSELLDDNPALQAGDAVYKGDMMPVNSTTYVNADDIIEMVGERAYVDVGQVADGWPDVSAAARQALDELLKAWVSQHCVPTFNWVCNVVEHRITEADREACQP